MSIEHRLCFHLFMKGRTPKTQKPCARWRGADSKAAASAPGDPAMVFEFRMASIPFDGPGIFTRYRPAAGLPLDKPRGPAPASRVTYAWPDACPDHAKTRA